MNVGEGRIPPLRTLPKIVEAQLFNRVRLALLRQGSPLRLPLHGLRGVDVILERHRWLAVDRFRNDMPILAVTDFETADRSDLHLPINCRLHLYHYHAGLVSGVIVTAIEAALERQANREQDDARGE